VLLVLAEVEENHTYSCSIINEIAENCTSCQVTVEDSQQLLTIDEDILRHSLRPRFTVWPSNAAVVEGDTVSVQCTVEGCNEVFLSTDFNPQSVDPTVKQLSKSGNNSWSTQINNIALHQSGLYFLTARNNHCEEKYPLIIKVKSQVDLSAVDACATENSSGVPVVGSSGPVFSRDGDTVVIKAALHSGQPPFNLSWTFNDQEIVWSNRVVPYNRPGSIGVQMTRVGVDDEGTYACTLSNSLGSATFSSTLLVDYAEQKESEVMAELCNCPMLDSITPLMSWSNTPIATPRRTPLPTPHGTPRATPRATPRVTPFSTPRATPTPSLGRRGYDLRSPSVSSTVSGMDDFVMPPPRRKFVQAPEIFSSFSNKAVEEGSTVEYKCFVSCAPLTTTTWEKDNMPIISGSQVTLSEKTGVRVLTIHCARTIDAGSYRMTITNKSGVSTCSANLTVKRKKLVPAEPVSTSSRGIYSYSSRRSYSSYSPYSSVRYL